MKTILLLTVKSLRNRKLTVSLTLISIALSVTLLLGVERIRTESRSAFMNTVSGTDLVVGARSSQIQLLLYSVFRIGHATNNISWQSYQEIANLPSVDWTVPISLGDSHKGYRVMGTNSDYFTHFKYGNKEHLAFAEGRPFDDLYDAVIGAEAAKRLQYQIGDSIIVSHGAGEVSFVSHNNKPFRVSGILKATGTPIDRTIHVSLEAIEAIHLGWKNGAPAVGQNISAELSRRMNLTPKAITAFMVKLNSPIATFKVQRTVNEYRDEALTAILPGVALQQLWELTGIAEKALFVVSAFVVVVGLFGMMTTMFTSLNERRREMAILRSVGAAPKHIFSLIIGEAVFITSLGIVLGITILYLLLFAVQPLMQARFGITLSFAGFSSYELTLIALVWFAGMITGVLPGWKIYIHSLNDGLTVRT